MVLIMTVTMVVGVWVISWPDVIHLVDRATFWAALDRTFAGGLFHYISDMKAHAKYSSTYSEPNSDMGISRRAGAATVLLVSV
jgi:hypothetical protein